MMIQHFQIDSFWKGEARVIGSVQDGESLYDAAVFLRDGRMQDYSCSCEGGLSGAECCPHCRELYSRFLTEREKDPVRQVTTSVGVRELIRQYEKRALSRTAGELEKAAAELIPTLHIDHGKAALTCRFRGKKEYKIRDLAVFAGAVRDGLWQEYGKDLAFTHTPDAFSEKSRPLLALILQQADACVERYREAVRKNGVMPYTPALPLDRAGRDRLFDILEGGRLEAELNGQVGFSLRLIRGNPPFSAEARPEGTEGISVAIPSALYAFYGETDLYVADWQALYRCGSAYTDVMGPFLTRMLSDKEKKMGFLSGRQYRVTVHKRDLPLFYGRVLKPLKEAGLLDDEGVDWQEYRPLELKARFFFESSGPDEITVRPSISYGDFTYNPLTEEAVPQRLCRDVAGEYRISYLIAEYFQYRDGEAGEAAIRGDEAAVYHFLSEGMERFKQAGETQFSGAFRSLAVSPPPRLGLSVSLNGGWLELDVDTGGVSGRELMEILSQYRLKKKYHRLKNGEFVTLSGDGLYALSRLTEGLSEEEIQSKRLRLPSYRAFYVDSLFDGNTQARLLRSQKFDAMIRELGAVEDVREEPPGELAGVLREYQKAGFKWLKTLWHYGFGGILADDMGLGKTLQILTLLASVYGEKGQRGPSLVVCPASLIYNWGHECSVFVPGLRVLLVAGSLKERQALLKKAGEYEVIVTSYDLLKRDLAAYQEIEFSFLILDEAQFIKNAATQTARAVKSVRAAARFALTGTPIENRLGELWSVFDFLMPSFLFSYRAFKERYEDPIIKEESAAALEELRRMIRPFVLRRLKSDVLQELPGKQEKVVYSAASGRQQALYRAEALRLKTRLCQAGEEQMKSARIESLAMLTRLRQICCDPSLCYENYNSGSAKLETAVSLIGSAVEGGHKLLVFSQFASMLETIKERLEKEGISCHLLTGGVRKEERNRMVTAFQEDSVPVFLISLKAGGTGLNLTAADIVIHYDPWWNMAAQNQATDRAHRIGQDRPVTVYKLIMKDTIEENILRLQESKRLLADQIVTEGMVSLGALGREELLAILDGGRLLPE